jgi:death-on-curing protein
MEPLFLTLDEILKIHQNQLELYGGETGVRDMGLLQSALAMPSAGFGDQLFHQNIHEMAAAYLYHIVLNHPFVDGNKRCGLVAAYVFLRLNNVQIKATDHELEKLTLDTAKSLLSKTEIAFFLKTHSKKL